MVSHVSAFLCPQFTARLKPRPFKTGSKDEDPMRDTFVESHPCAKNAQGWGTRPPSKVKRGWVGQPPRTDGSRGGYRKSKSPPCVCKGRRHKDGAPSGVEMNERVGQPPICFPFKVVHPADSLRTLYFFFPLLGLRGLGTPGLSPLLPFFFGAGESGVGGTPVGSEVILPLFKSTVTESRCITCCLAAVLNVMVRDFASVVTVKKPNSTMGLTTRVWSPSLTGALGKPPKGVVAEKPPDPATTYGVSFPWITRVNR